jgi:hypothetical protein
MVTIRRSRVSCCLICTPPRQIYRFLSTIFDFTRPYLSFFELAIPSISSPTFFHPVRASPTFYDLPRSLLTLRSTHSLAFVFHLLRPRSRSSLTYGFQRSMNSMRAFSLAPTCRAVGVPLAHMKLNLRRLCRRRFAAVSIRWPSQSP